MLEYHYSNTIVHSYYLNKKKKIVKKIIMYTLETILIDQFNTVIYLLELV